MTFTYCPNCGNKLIPKLAGDDGQVPYCSHCARFWFPTFSDCIIVLVANEFQELALVQMPYLSTQYESFVSGYMKPGESAEETTEREIYEELGLKVTDIQPDGTHWFNGHDMLMHGFMSTTKKQSLVRSPELGSARWVPAKEAGQFMFPDKPGNTASILYRHYLQQMA
jgi:NAD+ diphosphatase